MAAGEKAVIKDDSDEEDDEDELGEDDQDREDKGDEQQGIKTRRMMAMTTFWILGVKTLNH